MRVSRVNAIRKRESSLVREEKYVEQKVNYVLEMDGKFIIIENVPARVCLETGERLFSPATVDRLQQVIWEQKEPSRKIEVPVLSLQCSCD
jgi:YgiT-type zinc finger domain-containing protein